MSVHSEIDDIIEEAAQTFTGKFATHLQKEGYYKALRTYPIAGIRSAVEELFRTHSYRTIPVPAEIIKIIMTSHDSKQHGFIVRTPQVMVYKGHPRSKAEMTNYLKDPRTKREAYTAIQEWNNLKPHEQEWRFEEIGLGREKTKENLARIADLSPDFEKRIKDDEWVACCLCGEQALKVVSINTYLRYYDPDATQGVGEYACHGKGCTKTIINNAGHEI